jgi:hypothetical protein
LAQGTDATLILSDISPAQAGEYQVVVSNRLAVLTSQVARLTVLVAPSILQQPVGGIFSRGQTNSISVLATGIPAPAYQWVFNQISPCRTLRTKR